MIFKVCINYILFYNIIIFSSSNNLVTDKPLFAVYKYYLDLIRLNRKYHGFYKYLKNINGNLVVTYYNFHT